MEILTQTTHWWKYIIATFFVGVPTLFIAFLFIAGIAEVIGNNAERVKNTVITLVIGLILVFFTIGITLGIKQGPEITYEATITDFNEVYTKGYEVVEQRGKLYVIKKSEAN